MKKENENKINREEKINSTDKKPAVDVIQQWIDKSNA